MDNKILIVIDVQNGFITSAEHDKRAMQIAKLAKSGNFNKVIAKWLYAVSGNSNRSKLVNVRVGSVLVGNGGIEFDFRCDYEFYYEKTIDQYTSEDESWDEDTDILIKCLVDVGNDIDGDNVWVEIYFNDHDFDAD